MILPISMTGCSREIPLGMAQDGSSRDPTDLASRAIHELASSVRYGDHFAAFVVGLKVQATASAVTAILLVVALACWHVYEQWRLGWIELTSDGPPLVAQVLSAVDDIPLGDPFHVTARTNLALPAGEYRLRVHGVGRLSRTFRFAVNRGETQTHIVSLDEGRLLGGEPTPRMGNQEKPREDPIPFASTTVAIALTPGKADLIEWTSQAVIRRDGQTGKPIWDSSRPSIPWRLDQDSADRLRRWHESTQTLDFVQPAPDLNGDEIGDLVGFSRNMTSLLALSGGNGSVLWECSFELKMPGVTPADDPEMRGPVSPVRRTGFLVDAPVVTDLDQDGLPDLVATLVFYELPIEIERRSPSPPGAPGQPAANRQPLARRVIQAISGRTGRVLWKHPIDPVFTIYSNPAWSRQATMVPGRKQATVAYVDGADLDRARPDDRQAAGDADRSGIRARSTGPICGPRWRRRARDPGKRAGPSGRPAHAGRVLDRHRSKSLGHDRQPQLSTATQ